MNKKYLFFLFFLIVVSTEENEEFWKYRNSRSDSNERHDRQATSSSKLSKISSNHMKLARVANAIYIQKGLLDGSLSVDDVVAGVWNMKDKKVLEQLKGFPAADLKSRLTAMDRELNGVADGLMEVDVTDIATKMRPVDDMKPAIESVKAAVKMENYPKLITDPVFKFAFNDEHVKLKTCLEKLEKIENATVTTAQLDEAKNCLAEAVGAARTTYDRRGQIKEFLDLVKTDKALLEFKTSIPLVRAYTTQKADLGALKTALTTAGTSFDSLKAFFVPTAGTTGFRKIIEDARKSLKNLRDTASSANPVGIAFQDARSLNAVFDDLNSPWLKTVLNKGNPLQKFIEALKPLSDFSRGFSAISSALKNMDSNKIPAAIKLLDTFLARLEVVGAVSAKVSSLAKFKECLPETLPAEPAGVTEIEKLSEHLNGISAQLDSVYTPLNDLADPEEYSADGEQLRTSINAHKADKTKLINAKLLTDLKTKFKTYSNAAELASTEITKHSAFADYKHVDKVKSKVEEVKKWFKETNLADSAKCDLQSMDTSVLAGLNDLIKVVNEVKQNKPLARVSVISSEVPNLVKGLQQLKDLKKGGEKTDALSLNFVAAKPSSKLLDLAKGITNLHRMSIVHAAKTTDLQKVISAGPVVQSAIQSVRDANAKASLTTTWNGFPAVVASLTAFSAKLDELESKLQVKQERSLDDVAKTYQKASKLQTTGKIDLKPFTDSFLLIDPADPAIKDLERSFKAIDTPASQDLSLTFASFGTPLSSALNYFGQQVGAFQGPKPSGGQALQQSSGQPAGGQEPNWIILGVGTGFLVAVASGVAVFFWCCCFKGKYVHGTKYRMKKAKGTGPEEAPFTVNIEDKYDLRLSYIRLQDVRLEMNKMDKNNYTRFYKAVINKDWKATRELLDKGALVDVPCGPMMRTALHELVLMKDHEHAEWLCEKGAWIFQPDAHGEWPDSLGDRFGFHEMFTKYYGEDFEKRRVIPPKTPRPFNILVMNPHAMTLWRRRKIPARVKDKITWGYNYDKKIDLNQFTHIIIPPCLCDDNQTLTLDNNDLFRYKLVACLAILMHEDWLEAMITSDANVGYEEQWQIQNIRYNGIHFAESLFRLKTDLHMGRPKFLARTRITILDTKNEKQQAQKAEWEEIIELFGGKIYKVPEPDVDETTMPYSTLYPQYSANRDVQNGCWILRFDDSTINPIWRSDMEAYTLVPFNFLPHSIAQFYILPFYNTIYPMEYDIKDIPEEKKRKMQRSMMSEEDRINKPIVPNALPDITTKETKSVATKSVATDSKTPDTKTQKTNK